ncbi:hypothetical protein GCM10009559_81750 [Pseudonocardia zijingensis]|uniref:Uncharacterized protein n=1 Tax=Pseudonocardia zijingensis TaxID=153376 RepID=A0ABN1NKP1_9PSEU
MAEAKWSIGGRQALTGLGLAGTVGLQSGFRNRQVDGGGAAEKIREIVTLTREGAEEMVAAFGAPTHQPATTHRTRRSSKRR